MDNLITYRPGTPRFRRPVSTILDAVSDQLIRDGDVEKALQREFRIGSDDHMGLYDVLNRLAEEIQDVESQMADAADSVSRQRLQRNRDDLEKARAGLRQTESFEDLKGIDPDLLDRALLPDEREWIDEWMDITGQLIESGLVVHTGRKLELTPLAIRKIGARILRHIHLPPVLRGRGNHPLHRRGFVGLPSEATSPWEWGQPFDIHLGRTVLNAVRRNPGALPVRLTADDFEAHDRESGAAVATVLMIDMSRSMFASGAWDAAKRAAVALDALISSSLPQDSLDLVGFSGDARRLRLDDLPSLTWDQFSHGTNLQAGLRVAQSILQRHRGMNRQIVILTDGEPTAYLDGEKSIFEHPVTERTINATLGEAARVARAGIAVTTMMLATSHELDHFVMRFSRLVRGRVIRVPTGQLGSYVVRDVTTGSIRTIR